MTRREKRVTKICYFTFDLCRYGAGANSTGTGYGVSAGGTAHGTGRWKYVKTEKDAAGKIMVWSRVACSFE